MHQSPHCVIAYLQGVLIYMYTYNLDSQYCNAGGDKQPIWHNIGIPYIWYNAKDITRLAAKRQASNYSHKLIYVLTMTILTL